MSDKIYELAEIKNMIRMRQNVAGLTFANEKGARGTVMADLSSHGKKQAVMTCTVQGCSETHVREQSDWHQCSVCRTHNKTSKSGTSDKVTEVKDQDGNIVRMMQILDSDNMIQKAMKQQNNHLYNQLLDKQKNATKLEKERIKQERLQAEEIAREERRLKADEERRAKRAQNASLIKEYAAKLGVPVSKKTLDVINGDND